MIAVGRKTAEIGEIRQFLALTTQKKLWEIFNAKSHLKGKYWILVHMKWIEVKENGKKIRRPNIQFFIMNILPAEVRAGILNTMLIEVDNQLGQAKYLFCLPKDRNLTGFELEEEICKLSAQSVLNTGVRILKA